MRCERKHEDLSTALRQKTLWGKTENKASLCSTKGARNLSRGLGLPLLQRVSHHWGSQQRQRGKTEGQWGGGGLKAGSCCSCVYCCRPLPCGVSEGMWKGDPLCWWKQISILVWVAWVSDMNIYLRWEDRSSFLHPKAQQYWSLFTYTLTLTWVQHCGPNKVAGETHFSLHGHILFTLSLGWCYFDSKIWFCFCHCLWTKKYLVLVIIYSSKLFWFSLQNISGVWMGMRDLCKPYVSAVHLL